MTDDLYAILGVPRDATFEQIKQAYREKLAKRIKAKDGKSTLPQDIRGVHFRLLVMDDYQGKREMERRRRRM